MSPIILLVLLSVAGCGLYLLKFGFWLNRRQDSIVPHLPPRVSYEDEDDEAISISLFLSELERSRKESQ